MKTMMMKTLLKIIIKILKRMIKNNNNNYKYILDFYYFQQKINKEKDEELNNIYIYEMQHITNEDDIFNNYFLIQVLK